MKSKDKEKEIEDGILIVRNPKARNVYVSKARAKELFDRTLQEISAGRSLNKALKITGMPHRTFYKYINDDPHKNASYKRAKEIRAHSRFEQLYDIADEVRDHLTEPAEAKVILEINKFNMGVDNPKDFKEAEQPTQPQTFIAFVNNMSIEDRIKAIQADTKKMKQIEEINV